MRTRLNKKNNGGSALPFAIAMLAMLVVSLATIPLAVRASSYDKSAGKAPDPSYLPAGNGVLESTFTRNVAGIQGATHVSVAAPGGESIGGWI